MNQLNEAWKLINNASHEEKKELFKKYIQKLEKHRERFDTPNNRFNPYATHARRAMYTLDLFFVKTTGYSASWVPDEFLNHCTTNIGRPTKYSSDTRGDNCFFITQMVHRGSSETQAMKLLMRLRGDKAMTPGHLRELQDTYRDYKKVEGLQQSDLSILDNAPMASEFLEFDISNLGSDEIASHKAVAAFRSFFQELIDLIKNSHRTISTKKKSHPKSYACIIDWINAEYEDPLDYFYAHKHHRSVAIWKRKQYLLNYINSMGIT